MIALSVISSVRHRGGSPVAVSRRSSSRGNSSSSSVRAETLTDNAEVEALPAATGRTGSVAASSTQRVSGMI